MTGLVYPNVQPHAGSSLLEPRELGLRIQAPNTIDEGSPAILRGVIQLAEAIDHRALTLVATRPSLGWVVLPLRSIVPFEEDVEVVGDLRRGYFNINLGEQLKANTGLGRVYVFCALGLHVSNVLTIDVA